MAPYRCSPRVRVRTPGRPGHHDYAAPVCDDICDDFCNDICNDIDC